MAPGDEGVDEEDEVISVGHGEDRMEEQAVPANEDGDSEEAVVPKAMRDPGQPTEREREDHEVAARQPPRVWCAKCNGSSQADPAAGSAGGNGNTLCVNGSWFHG